MDKKMNRQAFSLANCICADFCKSLAASAETNSIVTGKITSVL